MTDETCVESVVKETVSRFDRIDIAIHSAGVAEAGEATDKRTLTSWQKIIDVNLTGVWMCERAVVRRMLQQE